jgi:predicted Zn-dependent peptidase
MSFKKLIIIFLTIGVVNMMTNLFSQNKEILDNGITFIHKYDSEQPIIGVIIFLKMGVIYEPRNLSGISSLLQAVITKGTKNRTAKQIAEEIESLGGTLSADSDYDYSTISLVVSNKYFEKSMEILSDIFFNPTFPKNEVEKEKLNIIAGILSRKDNIFDTALDEFLYNFYGKKHPYSRIPEGTIKTLKRIKREDLLNWWEKFYGVDRKNIVIVISGDIDYKTSKDIVMKYFSNIKKIKLPEIKTSEVNLKFKHIKKKKHFKQGYIMCGYKAPSLSVDNIKDFLSLKLLNLYLGGGMSGKLFEILREKQSLGYETNSFFPTRLLDSHFVVYIGLDYDRVDIAKKELNRIISEIKEGKLFGENDLKEIKMKFKGRYLLDHQTNLRQAWYLGFWEIMGLGCEYDEKYVEEIEKLKLEDVREAANKIFNENYVMVEIKPK